MAPSGFTSRLQREFSATRNQQHGNRSSVDRGSHPRGVYGLTRLSGTAATSSHGTTTGGVSTVARNVPRPVQTSSLKKENGGQDVSAVLVNRHGGPGKKVGWGSALSTPAPAPVASLGPTPADSINPPSSSSTTKSSMTEGASSANATNSSGAENHQAPAEHRPPLPPPPTSSNRNVPWAMHPPSNPPPTAGLPAPLPPNRGAPVGPTSESHGLGKQSNECRQEKGEGSLQQNEYTTRNHYPNERYDRCSGGNRYDPSYDGNAGAGREFRNDRYGVDVDSMRGGPSSSSHYQRRFPPLDEHSPMMDAPRGSNSRSEGQYPSYYRDSRDRDYHNGGGGRGYGDYRGSPRDYHDYRRGYHDRDRYNNGNGAYNNRSRDRYYGNSEDRRWRDDRYSYRRSYGNDYGGGYDRDRRDFRDSHNHRYSESYATDSRRNAGGDASRFGGYADEHNDRRDGYHSDPQNMPNSQFLQDAQHSDEHAQIPAAPAKQSTHQPPPQSEEDIILEAIREREAAEARARIRAERNANGEEENMQGASEDSHARSASTGDVVRPVVLLRSNQTSGEASSDSIANPQHDVGPSPGGEDPSAKSEPGQKYLNEADRANETEIQSNERENADKHQQNQMSVNDVEHIKFDDSESYTSREEEDNVSCGEYDAPPSESSQSESMRSETDASESFHSESVETESLKSDRSAADQPEVYTESFHENEEERRREVAIEQQQKILRQVAATRAKSSRNESDSSYTKREEDIAPAVSTNENDNNETESKVSQSKKDLPTAEMIAKAARAEYRRNRKPRTRGVLFRREPDGTLVNVDTEIELGKTKERKQRKKKQKSFAEKNARPKIPDVPFTPEKETTLTARANDEGVDDKEPQPEESSKPFVPAPSPTVSAWQAGPPPGMRLSSSPLFTHLSPEKERPKPSMAEEIYPSLSPPPPEEINEDTEDSLETISNNEQVDDEISCGETSAKEATNATSGAVLTLSSDDEHIADTSCHLPSENGAEERTAEKKKDSQRRPSRRVPRRRPKTNFSRHSQHSSRHQRQRPGTKDSKRITHAPDNASSDAPVDRANSHKSVRRKITSSRANSRHRKPKDSGNHFTKRSTERHRKEKENETDDARRPRPTRQRPKRTPRRRGPLRATEEKK